MRRYNQIIGFAAKPIKAGDHVHVHNLAMGDFERDYAFGADYKPIEYVANPATFQGIVREDGRVATRNYLGVISSVNCSAHVCAHHRQVLRRRLHGRTTRTSTAWCRSHHKTGCGMASDGEPVDLLRRVLAGYATHPNFHSSLMIGLGCEANQINDLLAAQGLKRSRPAAGLHHPGHRRHQQDGRRTASRASRNCCRRPTRSSARPFRPAHLTLGLQCGGSDGYSGITANPALGAAVDILVRNGGTRHPFRDARRSTAPSTC